MATAFDGRERYETMLAEVEAWQPPTPDHEELKRFMADQLRESKRGETVWAAVRFRAEGEDEQR